MKKLILVLMLLTSASHAQWTQQSGVFNKVNSFSQYSTTYYASTETSSSSGFVYKSTDEGVNWTSIYSGSPTYSFASTSSTSQVCARLNGIYYSPGGPWFQSNINWETRSLITDGVNYYSGTSQGVYKSTNNGQNWTSLGLNSTNVKCLLKTGTNFIAGSTAGIFYSTNNGSSWLTGFSPTINVTSLAYGSDGLWIGTSSQLYLSTNFGVSYATNFPLNCYSIATSGNHTFVGTNSGVQHFYSVIPGVTYNINPRNAGFSNPPPAVNALFVTNSYLLAGTDNAVWRSPYSYVTEIQNANSTVPATYSLSQNYPNPWNPSTTITYAVPLKGFVTLKVYDALGRLVATLVNEVCAPGTYAVEWNASVNTSGVYFYTLQTSNFTDTKRMVLIK